MKTEEIIKLLKLNEHGSDYWSWDELDFIPEETYKNLKEVGYETTNPRRGYVGTKTFIHNSVDDRYFFVEIYGNDMGNQICDSGEVRPIQKTVTVYEEI